MAASSPMGGQGALLVLALGDFGARVAAALEQAKQAWPLWTTPAVLWAGPSGFRQSSAELVAGDGSDLDPDGWLEAHSAAGLAALRSAIETLRPPAGQHVHILIAAHLCEPFSRGLLWPIAALATRVFPPQSRAGVTLVLAIDSRRLSNIPDHESGILSGALHDLEQRLAATSSLSKNGVKGPETGKMIRWCYLLDTLDQYANPLQPLSMPLQPVDPQVLQAHQAAMLALAMQNGMLETLAYQRFGQAELSGLYPPGRRGVRISTFGAGMFHFPVPGNSPQAAASLAGRLLNEFILGVERSGDTASAQSAALQWSAKCSLTPLALRHRLRYDPAARPLDQLLPPLELGRLHGQDLIKALEEWQNSLEQAWNDPSGPGGFLSVADAELLHESRNWLSSYLPDLIYKVPGGLWAAASFIKEARLVITRLAILAEIMPDNEISPRLSGWPAWLMRLAHPAAAPNGWQRARRYAEQSATARGRMESMRSRPWLLLLKGLPNLIFETAAYLKAEWNLRRAAEDVRISLEAEYRTRLGRAWEDCAVRIRQGLTAQLMEWEDCIAARRTGLRQALDAIQHTALQADENVPMPFEQVKRVPGSETAVLLEPGEDLARDYLTGSASLTAPEQIAAGLFQFVRGRLEECARKEPLKERLRQALELDCPRPTRGWEAQAAAVCLARQIARAFPENPGEDAAWERTGADAPIEIVCAGIQAVDCPPRNGVKNVDFFIGPDPHRMVLLSCRHGINIQNIRRFESNGIK